MTTAFVLSGGGSLGAVQVGMLRALAERNVSPDLLVGTSAGALNAVFVAAHGTAPAEVDRLAAIVADAAGTDEWSRLKACRRHSCLWAFYDHARNKSRAWCSMEVCGNREKARSFRQRHATKPA